MDDVIIVGASLAGSAAAIHLAGKGYSVEVLDQSAFPRRKACGEGLFSTGVQELRSLGVLEDVAQESAAVTSMSFRLGDAVVEAALPLTAEPHLGIRRDLLDQRLLSAAVDAGAKVTTGVQVRRVVHTPDGYVLETTAGSMKARMIVGADGINSRLRHDAELHHPGRSRRFGVSAHMMPAREIPPRIEVIFGDGHEAYLTPVGNGILNVALLLGHPASLSFKGDTKSPFVELLRLSGIEGELIDEPLMAGPFPARAKALRKDNLVLTGDAAGFFDPITGEGMNLALRSARLCAESVAAYLRGDERAFENYTKQHRAMMRDPEMLARLMLFLASHQSLGRRAILNLRRHPETLTKLIATNNGIAGFRELRPRDLTALLFGL